MIADRLNRATIDPKQGGSLWDIMGHICGAYRNVDYTHRIEMLKNAGIALWDVLRYCLCNGSLDREIDSTSEIANDLEGFLAKYPEIRCICFNGAKAATLFDKHVRPTLSPYMLGNFRFITLPSSSHANTRLTARAKLKQWQVMMKYLSPRTKTSRR